MSAAELSAMASLAIGLALSPMAIIELLLVLLSKRRVINSVAFVISLWVMMAIAVVLGALGSRAAAASASSDGSSTRWVLAIFAVVMIGLAIMNWIKRRDTSEPKVFRAIGDMGPIAVALLTPGLTLINPKNLPLLLGGGEIAASASSPAVAGALFILLASTPFWLAMGFSLFGGAKAEAVLERCRMWLIKRNKIVMAITCAILGVVFLLKAFGT